MSPIHRAPARRFLAPMLAAALALPLIATPALADTVAPATGEEPTPSPTPVVTAATDAVAEPTAEPTQDPAPDTVTEPAPAVEAEPTSEPAPTAASTTEPEAEPVAAEDDSPAAAEPEPAAATVTADDLADVDQSAFTDEISWLVDEGLSRGFADGLFHPRRAVTREAIAAFLYRYAGEPAADLAVLDRFSDVSPGSNEHAAAIAWLTQQGITRGYADGTFRPRQPLARDAMAAFLLRFEDGQAAQSEVFIDSDRSPAFTGAIEWLAQEGVSEGYVTTRGREYHPFAQITREAMAAFLYRLDHGAPAVKPVAPARGPNRFVTRFSQLPLHTSASSTAHVAVRAPYGHELVTTGAHRNGYFEVNWGGEYLWGRDSYLSTSEPAPRGPNRFVTRYPGLGLHTHASSTSSTAVVAGYGKELVTTGAHRNGYYEVNWGGRHLWARDTQVSTSKPISRGPNRFVTVGHLSLHTHPSSSSAVAASAGYRKEVWTTGAHRNGYYEVIWGGHRLWGRDASLSTSRPPALATGSPRDIGRVLVAQRGWSSAQFTCLDRLFTRESGWNPHAMNPYSGAYGIPQALPGGKMSTAGADWRTNPATQIKWGLGYIAARYGTPCGAWSHSQARGWY